MIFATPNDVCLRAHKGKHRIIASETSNIIMSEAKNIISPYRLTSKRIYGIITEAGGVL